LKLLVVILADKSGSSYTLPGDTASLLEDSACWKCLTDKQILQAIISALAEDIESDSTVEEIRAKIQCLLCADPKTVKAAIGYLVCSNFTT